MQSTMQIAKNCNAASQMKCSNALGVSVLSILMHMTRSCGGKAGVNKEEYDVIQNEDIRKMID